MTLSSRMSELQAPEPHRSADAARKSPRSSTSTLPVEFARARAAGHAAVAAGASTSTSSSSTTICTATRRATRPSRPWRTALRKHARKPVHRLPLRRRRVLRHPARHLRSVGRGARGTPACRGSTLADGRSTPSRVSIGYACQSDSRFESADTAVRGAPTPRCIPPRSRAAIRIAAVPRRRAQQQRSASAAKTAKTLRARAEASASSATRRLRSLLHCHRVDHSCSHGVPRDRTEAERARAAHHGRTVEPRRLFDPRDPRSRRQTRPARLHHGADHGVPARGQGRGAPHRRR